jgi:hypothetical protein
MVACLFVTCCDLLLISYVSVDRYYGLMRNLLEETECEAVTPARAQNSVRVQIIESSGIIRDVSKRIESCRMSHMRIAECGSETNDKI